MLRDTIHHCMNQKNEAMYKARQKAGLSMERLALKAGVSLATIYRMENNLHTSSIINARKVAKAFRTSVDKLFK